MSRKNNSIIISIIMILYIINQITKTKIPYDFIRWFMTSYFNDMIGGIAFISYCNLMLSFCKKGLTKLCQIEAIMFLCGLFWEYVTPLFRTNTTSDIFDVVAYMIGGIIYWLIIKKVQNISKKSIKKSRRLGNFER